MVRPLVPGFAVAGQIAPADVAGLAAAGFATIINNRPDGEAPDQPEAATIAAAAAAAGLDCRHIAVGAEGLTPQAVAALRAAIDESEGPVLAFCRSGMRSAALWALAEAGRHPADEILAATAAAGYDLSPLRPQLERGG